MRWLGVLVLLGLLLSLLFSLVRISPFNYTKADAPKALQSIDLQHPSPKVAIVLGGGGPRGRPAACRARIHADQPWSATPRQYRGGACRRGRGA